MKQKSAASVETCSTRCFRSYLVPRAGVEYGQIDEIDLNSIIF